MRTLTKEWLLKTIAELEEERDATPGAVNEDAAMALEAMKRALASLEAEPVYQVLVDGSWTDYDKQHLEELLEAKPSTLFRVAYPSPRIMNPVSVDADDNFYSWFGREWHEHYQHNQYTTAAKQMLGVMAESAWKAGRRAAMLQGADGNSPVFPDGWVACSERMPEIGSRVIVAIEEKYVRSASYTQWDGAKTERGRAPRFEDLRGIVHGVTHWQPLPSPPAK
ncbi:DUF551 domain-containing protein [Candidatus Erwinia dacicola]|uniref:DUF551 domain-containing protein n=1 Tax=Candidatus Erwinia dacicola TaxID=252393 RepID=A0A1E7Z2Q0_9GAMM|nr:DUF551 domain-containing protein [Candidatus Erwinia dacicola]OFC63057.1 hypothetical protein BBW68_07210 [Candidatus Erwinia dacicola]RAP71550.1 hypothetical protein ACZ87_01627 [Candidatus Erwinia dacicola]